MLLTSVQGNMFPNQVCLESYANHVPVKLASALYVQWYSIAPIQRGDSPAPFVSHATDPTKKHSHSHLQIFQVNSVRHCICVGPLQNSILYLKAIVDNQYQSVWLPGTTVKIKFKHKFAIQFNCNVAFWYIGRQSVFNLSNQLSNFSKNWEWQRGKTKFLEFYSFLYSIFAVRNQK